MTNFLRLKSVALLVVTCAMMSAAGCRHSVMYDREIAGVLVSPEEGRRLAENLRIEWQTELPMDAVRDIYMDDGILYVESAYGLLAAVDPREDGAAKWIRPTRQALDYSPCSSGDKLFFFSGGRMSVWDRNTGTPIVEKDPKLGLAAPPKASSRFVLGVGVDGRAHGIGQDNLWPEWTTGMQAIPVRDAVDFIPPDAFYVITMDSDIRRYDALSGSLRWKQSAGNVPPLAGPLAAAKGVYFGGQDGFVRYLDNSGLVVWKQAVGGPTMTQPKLAFGRLIVIAYPNTAVALDAETGSILWKQEGPARFLTATQERAYFLSSHNRKLMAFSMADGSPIGALDAREFARFAAEPETGRFLAVTREGHVYGYVDAAK